MFQIKKRGICIEWVDFKYIAKAMPIIESHAPYKRFYTYFDVENFWLLDYPCSEEHTPYGILESWDGTVLAVYHINCGYGGYGPSQTSRLLQNIGISEVETEKWKWESGIEIAFDTEGNYIKDKVVLGSVFESRAEKEPEILLNDVVISNRTNKTVCYLNPQLNHLQSLMTLLKYCEPKEYQSYYGNYASDYLSYENLISFQYRKNGDYDIYSLSRGGFVSIKGDKFNVVILASKRGICTMIQILHYILFSKEYFHETHIGTSVVYTEDSYQNNFFGKIQLVLHLLFSKETPDNFFQKKIPPKESRRGRW